VSPDRLLDLLALGDPCVDLVYLTDRLPAWDDKARGTLLGLFGGGTEANAACNAARLGWRCALFGGTGDDLHADLIRRELAEHGVQLQHLARTACGSSSVAVVAVSAHGERSVVWLPPGNDGAPPPDRGDERRKALAHSRWAYTMPYDAATLAQLARETAAAGTRLAIDIEREGARAVSGGLELLLQNADLAFLNQGGFEAATGQAPNADTLQALCRGGRARTVVVTLGADGALAADRDEGVTRALAFPAEVADTTGAGDTFNASFLVARDRGASLRLALQQACRAAARTVAAIGARGALPTFTAADAGPHMHVPRAAGKRPPPPSDGRESPREQPFGDSGASSC
jgi:sugar/nucleoside kinase (ribokinase family)